MPDNKKAMSEAVEAASCKKEHDDDVTESGCMGGCGHSAKSLEQSAMIVSIGCIGFVILIIAIGGAALINLICGGK